MSAALAILGYVMMLTGTSLAAYGVRQRSRDVQAYAACVLLLVLGAFTCVCAVSLARS